MEQLFIFAFELSAFKTPVSCSKQAILLIGLIAVSQLV